MFLVLGGLAFLSHYYTIDGIKSKTVGDGQHGTARWPLHLPSPSVPAERRKKLLLLKKLSQRRCV